MDGEVVRLEACAKCGASMDSGAKFCAGCGGRVKSAATQSVGTVREAAQEFASGAATEIKTLSIQALKSETGKKIAAGAAMGATAGLVIPFVGPAIGATVGAAYVAFARLTK